MKSILSVALICGTTFFSMGQSLLTENFDSYQGFGDNLTGGWSSGQFKVYIRNLNSTTTTKLCQVNINQFHKTDSLTTPSFGPLAATASLQFQSKLCSYTGSFPTLGYVPGAGDQMLAYISADGGTTYQLLQDMTSSYTQTGNTFTDFNIPISGFEGQNVKVKFKVIRGTTGTEWYTDFDNFDISNITSVQPVLSSVPFSLVPNPASGRLVSVIAPDFSDKAQVEVFNILGTRVLETTLHAGHVTLNLADLDPGIYVVRLREAKITTAKRLILK